MKKSYKLLKLLYEKGSFDEGSGIYSNKIHTILNTSEDDVDKMCKELIKKGYIDPEKYRDLEPLRSSKVIVTEKGKEFVTEYLNAPWYTKIEIQIKRHKSLLIVLGIILMIIIYLVSGCKITDGFSAIDCTKTLIKK